jgi:hypothetical protein
MQVNKKVFCIGFHKTGTTSIGKAMELLGYRNIHGAGLVRKQLGDLKMMELLFRKDYRPFIQLAEQFDSFNDNPWFKIYKELDQAFPGSKFILTLRDENEWIQSVNHYFGSSTSPLRWWIYGRGGPMCNNAKYLEIYRKHNQQVKDYFSNRRNNLLILPLDGQDKMKLLTTFLGLTAVSFEYPHENKSNDY